MVLGLLEITVAFDGTLRFGAPMSFLTFLLDVTLVATIVAAGFGTVALASGLGLQLGEASKTTALFLPLLVFLMVTGKITGLEVQGFKAQFQQIASERIIDAARAADLSTSSIEANEPDFSKQAILQGCQPYFVISNASATKPDGALDRLRTLNIARSLRASIVCGNLKGLVVVDRFRKPLGFFPASQFLELLGVPLETYGGSRQCTDTDLEFCDILFKQIASSELGVVLANPEVRAKSPEAHRVIVSSRESLVETYGKLAEERIPVALIVDRHGRFDGIVTRSSIESRVIARLMEGAKGGR
jgi:hypothetical protein